MNTLIFGKESKSTRGEKTSTNGPGKTGYLYVEECS